jgi:membrane carboxypeptidase/penicillin-binding protein
MNAIPVPCAGKTGTTNDHKDAWFVCFTYGPDGITVLAWVGYDEFARPLPAKGYARKATGGSVALPIVREIMLNAYGKNAPLGEPPRFPRELEASIDQYIYWYYTFPQMIQ